MRFSILQRDGFRCRYCGRSGSTPGVVLHVDHIVPRAAGGTSTAENLATACEECNLGKGGSCHFDGVTASTAALTGALVKKRAADPRGSFNEWSSPSDQGSQTQGGAGGGQGGSCA